MVKMVRRKRIEKNMVEEVDKTKCQKLSGKTSSILRLQGLIGLPVMTSLTDNANTSSSLEKVQGRVRL